MKRILIALGIVVASSSMPIAPLRSVATMTDESIAISMLAPVSTNTNDSLQNIECLSFEVEEGHTYIFEFLLIFRVPFASTGIGLGVLTLNDARGDLIANATIPASRDGSHYFHGGSLLKLGDEVVAMHVPSTRSYVARIKGVLRCKKSGKVEAGFRPEVDGVNATIEAGSSLFVSKF